MRVANDILLSPAIPPAGLIDPEKIEELLERSNGVADTVHERLLAMGVIGDERTTRRAVPWPSQGVVGLGIAAVTGPGCRARHVAAVRLWRRPLRRRTARQLFCA